MPTDKIFPTIIIGLSFLAALAYAITDPGNWRMIMYWTAAATLNYAVTW